MKLSIITINYNNLQGLEKTYHSIVSQTCQDFEWIVIDGGSTDGSKEFIEEHKCKFSYWVSEPDKGIYNAMNKGITLSSGEYLNFLNSGDVYYSQDSLEHVFPYLQKGSIDIFYGDLLFSDGERHNVFHYPTQLSEHYFVYRSLGHPATFISTNLLKKEMYREDFSIVSDWYSFFKWYRAGKSFFHIELIIAIFDTNGASYRNEDLIKAEQNRVFVELLGKDNIKWVEESINMQKLKEKSQRKDYILLDRIILRGGLRARIISLILQLTNRTF